MTEKNDLAEALFDISKSLRLLGSGNIAREDTEPGAIEHLDRSIKETGAAVASALGDIAEAITTLAHAVEDFGKKSS
jgi:hypothetical protein